MCVCMSVSEFLCTALSVTEPCCRVASLCAAAWFLHAPVRQSFQRWWRWGGMRCGFSRSSCGSETNQDPAGASAQQHVGTRDPTADSSVTDNDSPRVGYHAPQPRRSRREHGHVKSTWPPATLGHVFQGKVWISFCL